jgi:uncharacterized Ntn-hydrolase superfamily protein
MQRLMLPLILALAGACAGAGESRAQDTFSICAVDPLTQQVGSAGASCISGSIILSDVHPGVGVIHTQAYWNGQNQAYARTLMDQGHSPQEIIDLVVANDAGGNPTIRQYGVVDLVTGGRSAAYTGSNCTNYKGHITGATYAIQGNILLGPQILEDMETAFLTTPGTFADRLMAALQAAKVPGADTRCADEGKSSISAFIRVAKPGDQTAVLYLDLNVNNTNPSTDPIDVLQGLYDTWRAQAASVPPGAWTMEDAYALGQNHPNPVVGTTWIAYRIPEAVPVRLTVFDVAGRAVATLFEGTQEAGLYNVEWDGGGAAGTGIYVYVLEAGSFRGAGKLVLLRSGK